MWAIVKKLGGELPEKLADVPASERPTWLGERYVEGTTAFEDEAAKAGILVCNKKSTTFIIKTTTTHPLRKYIGPAANGAMTIFRNSTNN